MTPRLKCGLAGAALLLIAPFLLKWSVLDVLEQARAHAAEVSWSEKSIFVIPVAFFGGIAGLVCAAMQSFWVNGFDPSRRRHFSDLTGPQKVAVVTTVIVLLGVSFALRSWFLGELAELGYQV